MKTISQSAAQNILDCTEAMERYQRDAEGYRRAMSHDIDKGYIRSASHSKQQIDGLEVNIKACEQIINRLWGEL